MPAAHRIQYNAAVTFCIVGRHNPAAPVRRRLRYPQRERPKRKASLTFVAFALGCRHNTRYDSQQIRRLFVPLKFHVEVKSMSKTFAARLNRLFDTVYPPGRGPHTSAEVIAAL